MYKTGCQSQGFKTHKEVSEFISELVNKIEVIAIVFNPLSDFPFILFWYY